MEKVLQPQTAEKIEHCIDAMDKLVSAGMQPDEALEEVSLRHNLIPGHIELLGRAYNTGIINYGVHEEKSASFIENAKLCSPHKVISKLFPSLNKKADESIDLFYAYSPQYYFNKIATALSPTEATRSEKETSLETLTRKLRKEYQTLLLTKAAAENTLLELKYIIETDLERLENYFRKQGAINPEEVKINCSIVYPGTEKILNNIKIASNIYRYNAPVNWNSEPYLTILNIYDNLTKLAQINEQNKLIANELKEIQKRIKQAMEDKDEEEEYVTGNIENKEDLIFDKEKLKSDIEESLNKKQVPDKIKKKRSCPNKEIPIKEAAGNIVDVMKEKDPTGLFSAVTTIVPPLTTVEKPDGKVSGSEIKLSKKLIEANTYKVKALLADMMLNDPIISKHNPDDVYKAYVRLLQIAPNIMDRSEIVRTMLRKMLEGQLEPADISNLVELDKMLLARPGKGKYNV